MSLVKVAPCTALFSNVDCNDDDNYSENDQEEEEEEVRVRLRTRRWNDY